jgi:hypothetical protein
MFSIPLKIVQETHFKENDAQGMAIMAKFKTHNSTYNVDENRQKGASIFFSDKFWTEDECLYKSDNGDLIGWDQISSTANIAQIE